MGTQAFHSENGDSRLEVVHTAVNFFDTHNGESRTTYIVFWGRANRRNWCEIIERLLASGKNDSESLFDTYSTVKIERREGVMIFSAHLYSKGRLNDPGKDDPIVVQLSLLDAYNLIEVITPPKREWWKLFA